MGPDKIIFRARVRLLTSVAVNAVLRNATGLLVLLIAAALLKRTLGLTIPGAWLFPAACFFVVGAAVEIAVRAPGHTAAALVLDRALATHELFVTALEVESAPGDIPGEIRTRAVAAAGNCDVRTAVPLSVSSVLLVVPLVLTAVLLTIPVESAAPTRVRQFNGSVPGGNTDRALDSVRVRLETIRTVTEAVAEMEALGVPGLRDAVERGDIEAASAAASAAGDGIDRTAASNIVDRLRKRTPDRELRDRLTRCGGEDLGEVIGILAEYTAGANVSALVTSLETFEAAAAAASVSGTGQPMGTGDAALPPDEIAPGESPIVDLDSVPSRYRDLVKRYFTNR